LLPALALLVGQARADEKPDPAFEHIKSLAGEWEGVAREAGMTQTTKASFRVVSGGSAVMLVTDQGTSHEMITMFHRDDGAILATHYCAAMNQPRLRALPSTDPTMLAFHFVDGTNLGTHPDRMQRLVLKMPDTNRLVQEWTFLEGAKTTTSVFELKRKK
jgi:hypothetical protein